MKKLIFLILLSLPLISVSCKKKENKHSSYAVSKGDFMILVVSDSVECAMEYRKSTLPSSTLSKSPAYITAEFSNGNYDVMIYTPGVGLYGFYEQNVLGGYWGLDFPKFTAYSSETFIDSIPGNQLEKKEFYTLPLDTSKIDFIGFPSYKDKVESAWNEINDLRIVYEYRKRFPDSQIAFLRVEKQNGETKSYFFMNKYKP